MLRYGGKERGGRDGKEEEVRDIRKGTEESKESDGGREEEGGRR
jgi:hypothetical protein